MLRKIVVSALFVMCALAVAGAVALAAEPGSIQIARKGYVLVGDIFNVPEGTIEFWIKPASTENNEWVVGKSKDKASAMEFGFGPVSIMHMVKRNNEWTYAADDKKGIPLNEWTHVACTFDKQKATLFVNGAVKYARGDNFSLEHLAGGALTIGSGSNKQEMFNGLIAEVRLSSAIRYTGAFTPSKVPFESDAQTVALYHFGEEGDVVADSGPQKSDGKIVGAVKRNKESPFVK